MILHELRRRCEARLQQVPLPAPFEVRGFARRLARQRGRPIQLRPMKSGAGPHGLWLATEEADIVFYEQRTSSAHREHIILHELCHMLCGHELRLADEIAGFQTLAPDLAPETIARMLGRSSYSDDDEREAELLASLILERAHERRATEPVAPPDPANGAYRQTNRPTALPMRQTDLLPGGRQPRKAGAATGSSVRRSYGSRPNTSVTSASSSSWISLRAPSRTNSLVNPWASAPPRSCSTSSASRSRTGILGMGGVRRVL